MKNKETLEEASWKYNPLKKLDGEFLRHAFKEGAKWQAERMYSEDDVIIILNKFGSNVYGNYTRNEMMCDFVDKWFEQFKNK